jgi:hypothetical protein
MDAGWRLPRSSVKYSGVRGPNTRKHRDPDGRGASSAAAPADKLENPFFNGPFRPNLLPSSVPHWHARPPRGFPDSAVSNSRRGSGPHARPRSSCPPPSTRPRHRTPAASGALAIKHAFPSSFSRPNSKQEPDNQSTSVP